LPAIHATSRASRQACRQGYCDRQTIQWITHSLCSSPCFNVRFGSGPGIRFRSPVRHEDKKSRRRLAYVACWEGRGGSIPSQRSIAQWRLQPEPCVGRGCSQHICVIPGCVLHVLPWLRRQAP
jgi:hypothetical protein